MPIGPSEAPGLPSGWSKNAVAGTTAPAAGTAGMTITGTGDKGLNLIGHATPANGLAGVYIQGSGSEAVTISTVGATGTYGLWVLGIASYFQAQIDAHGGVISDHAAAAPTELPQIQQLSSYLTITSGALPNTGAWVSGTAQQNPIAQDITVNVVVVTDGTANAASCTIDISPDNVTYTTIGAPGASAAVNTVGAETFLCPVSLPATWYIKLTLVHCTVAASVYY
jgi:hypothetical protein